MITRTRALALGLVAWGAVACGPGQPPARMVPVIPRAYATPFRLPPHPGAANWLNSKGLTAIDLEDKVLLVELWTYHCKFCEHSHPWVGDVARRMGREGLVVFSVHAPETRGEVDPRGILAFARAHKIDWPIYLDRDLSYFEALLAEGWPTFVLVDRDGRVRARTLGAAEPGSPQARGLELVLRRLLRGE